MKKKNLLIIITLCILIALSYYIKFYTPKTTLNPIEISYTEQPIPSVDIIVTPEPTIAPTPTALEYQVQDKMKLVLEASLRGEIGEVNGWGYKTEYGYYVVNNARWDYLTVWYDEYELPYSSDRSYSSLSDEHVPNGTIIYPVNEACTNEFGNTFIPFVFVDLKHPEYTDDGDGIYWLLYENFNGRRFLDHYPPED